MRSVVSPQGRVTIPKPIRDSLALRPGDHVEWLIAADGRVIMRKAAGDHPASLSASRAPKPHG